MVVLAASTLGEHWEIRVLHNLRLEKFLCVLAPLRLGVFFLERAGDFNGDRRSSSRMMESRARDA
jgi:hypothetical protein